MTNRVRKSRGARSATAMKYLLFLLLLAASGRVEPYKPRIDPEFIEALEFLSEEKIDGYNYTSGFLRWRDKMQ